MFEEESGKVRAVPAGRLVPRCPGSQATLAVSAFRSAKEFV